MSFVLAGLLQGAGQGITNIVRERRENALAALKRQQEKEDYATERADSIADSATKAQHQMGLLQLGAEIKKQEGETEQQYKERLLEIGYKYKLGEIGATTQATITVDAAKTTNDVKLAEVNARLEKDKLRLQATLDTKKDAASQRLKRDLESGDMEFAGTTPEGFAVMKKRDGSLVTTTTKLAPKGGAKDDEDEPTIAGARQGRGEAPAPAKPAAAKAPVNPLTVPPPDGRKGRTMTGPGGQKVYWNGRVWVPLLGNNVAEQRRLLNGG